MKIEKVCGLYYATGRASDGTVCMGYSVSHKEAWEFCWELLDKREAKK